MVPPRESLMPRATRESPMWRGAGRGGASRASFGTTRGAPVGPVGAGEALVEVDPVVGDVERGQGLALGGEVLQDGGAPGVADEFSHPGSVSFSLPSPDYGADWSYETASAQAVRLAKQCPRRV